MKRFMVVLVMICLIGWMAACSSSTGSGNKTGGDTGSSVNNSGSNGSSGNNGADNAASNKKFTITSIAGTWASPIPAPDGEGVKKINERFNVDFQPQFVPYDEYANKLPIVMAAGDLPDRIGMEGADANFVKWAKQGAFLPLNDYIDQYETLKAVPDYVWDAVTVDGKIYAIPQYFPPKYGKKPIIRKDWLDNLGLPMPTNYEELKQVAIAFTKNDPDRNGVDDTYGIGLAQRIVYGAWMGVAWDSGWYHRNEQGQLIPGGISESFKQQIQLLHDLYQEGAIHKDWAVTKGTDARNDFFAGKFGIWYEQPYDIGEQRFKTLKELHPDAELAVIPPFVQDDGQQGFLSLPGFYEITALNANLKDDPEKVHRILEIEDYFRKFIPVDQRNPDNPDFDWQNGGVGVGYDMVNGVAIDNVDMLDPQPQNYIVNRYWAPNDEANEPAKVLSDPFTVSFVQNAVDLLANTKFYVDPVNRIHSPELAARGSELNKILEEYQTKMIVGQIPISDWDRMVEDYLNQGGQIVIDEVNKILDETGITGEWR